MNTFKNTYFEEHLRMIASLKFSFLKLFDSRGIFRTFETFIKLFMYLLNSIIDVLFKYLWNSIIDIEWVINTPLFEKSFLKDFLFFQRNICGRGAILQTMIYFKAGVLGMLEIFLKSSLLEHLFISSRISRATGNYWLSLLVKGNSLSAIEITNCRP